MKFGCSRGSWGFLDNFNSTRYARHDTSIVRGSHTNGRTPGCRWRRWCIKRTFGSCRWCRWCINKVNRRTSGCRWRRWCITTSLTEVVVTKLTKLSEMKLRSKELIMSEPPCNIYHCCPTRCHSRIYRSACQIGHRRDLWDDVPWNRLVLGTHDLPASERMDHKTIWISV